MNLFLISLNIIFGKDTPRVLSSNIDEIFSKWNGRDWFELQNTVEARGDIEIVYKSLPDKLLRGSVSRSVFMWAVSVIFSNQWRGIPDIPSYAPSTIPTKKVKYINEYISINLQLREGSSDLERSKTNI